MEVPFLSFDTINASIEIDAKQAFSDFFNSKSYVLGGKVDEFERQYASFSETNHAIGVGNGLDALHLSLRALGVGSGDEVIIPSNTFIATVLAVSYVGATPVFVEPSLDTYNIDVVKIEDAITKNTKVIMPVHLYGQACEMVEVMALASKHGLYVVEDNAQAQGARCNDQMTGSFGDLSGTSFYPGKNLGAFGDAGAVTTNSIELAEKIKVLRNYGSEKKYHNEIIGYNSRLDELQGALLSVKLKRLAKWNEERNQIASWYNELLKSPDIVKPRLASGCTSVYHLYVIRHPKRGRLQQCLNEKGIGTLIHYPIPPHLQKAYESLGFTKGDFPIAEQLSNEVLSLPLHIGMTKDQVEYVCEQINGF